MSFDFSTTSTVTTTQTSTAPLECDKAFIRRFVLNGSKLSAELMTADMELVPYASATGVFADPAQVIELHCSSIGAMASYDPDAAAFMAAHGAFVATLQVKITARATALAAAQSALTAAQATTQAALAAALVNLQAVRVSNPTNSTEDIAARMQARDAYDTAQASATTTLTPLQAAVVKAQAAVSDFANPPV